MTDQSKLVADLKVATATFRGLESKIKALADTARALEDEQSMLIKSAGFEDEKAVNRIASIRVKIELLPHEHARLEKALEPAKHAVNLAAVALANALIERADKEHALAFDRAAKIIMPLCAGDSELAGRLAGQTAVVCRWLQWRGLFSSVTIDPYRAIPQPEQLLEALPRFERNESPFQTQPA